MAKGSSITSDPRCRETSCGPSFLGSTLPQKTNRRTCPNEPKNLGCKEQLIHLQDTRISSQCEKRVGILSLSNGLPVNLPFIFRLKGPKDTFVKTQYRVLTKRFLPAAALQHVLTNWRALPEACRWLSGTNKRICEEAPDSEHIGPQKTKRANIWPKTNGLQKRKASNAR